MRSFLICTISLLGVAAVFAVADESASTLDGQNFSGKVVSLDSKNLTLDVAGKKKQLEVGDILELNFAKVADFMQKPGQKMVETFAGDKVSASNIILSGMDLSFDSPMLGKVTMSFDKAKVIVIPRPTMTPAAVFAGCAKHRYETETRDMLVMINKKGDWVSAQCAIEGIGKEKISFVYDEKTRSVNTSRVVALWVAEYSEELPTSKGKLICVDGTVLNFTSVALKGDTFEVETIVLGKVKVSRSNVASIRFVSDRLAFLSELTPESIKEHGFFDTKYPYRANRSVSGQPLILDGKVYKKGLGMHSFSELTYDLGGKYKTFVADLGIDDSVKPNGQVAVEILGDGKVLKKFDSITGKDKARQLRLDVSGVKKMTIRVGFGKDKLDIADHLNIGDAKLIK